MPRHHAPKFTIAGAACVLTFALAVSGCSDGSSAQSVPGARSASASLPDLRDFTGIKASGPDSVTVKVGRAFAVSAQGDPKVLEQIEIGVKDGILHIGRKSRMGVSWNRSDKRAILTVAMPALSSASVAGSGDMTIDRVQGDALALTLAGSGNLTIGTAKVGALKASLTGSGSMRVAGAADTASLSATGSGDIDAGNLKAGRGDINVLGSGNARLASDGAVAVHIMGSGNADVRGTAKCTIAAMGSGKARCGV